MQQFLYMHLNRFMTFSLDSDCIRVQGYCQSFSPFSPSLKQDRISLWHEQTNRYATELRELKQQMVAQLENLDKENEVLRNTLESVGARVDRVEREMDYLETQNGAQPCVDMDDKLLEQQVTQVKEDNKAKYAKLSGEMRWPGGALL